jgi:L-ascorbate metabolism protein UlaG (beta-lactamase superfamily)
MQQYRGYALPGDSVQAALAVATAPFDSVDVVLATHRHGDHFHPRPAADHLRANARASFVTSAQVLDSLRSGAFGVHRDQLLSRTMPRGTVRRETVNGVPLILLGLPHGGDRHTGVEHLAFVVELGGRRILHFGDGDLSDGALAPLRLDTLRIDLALLPHWALATTEMRALVERHIRPVAVAAFHLGDGDARVGDVIRRAIPTATILTREGTTLVVR